MKIVEVRCARLRVPLLTPFKTALRTAHAVEDVVVTLHADTGQVGHGGAAATAVITGDTHGSIVEAVRRYIAPRVVGAEVADLNRVVGLVQGALEKNTSAKAAVEIALYDLFGQLYGAPLYKLLGGGEPAIETDVTISVGDAEAMARDALAALGRGFRALKVKVGHDVAADVERVKAVHAAVGGRASLRLDANQGWAPKQAVRALRALEDAGVALELVEQPVKARDLEGLKYVTDRVLTPVMADESAFGPAEALEVMRRRAADIVNIKLMKAGGISRALQIADLAAVYGVECMMGCMLEAGVSVAAAAHVAAARAGVITKIDLDGPSLCAHDPVEGGAAFAGPRISLADAPGLGIRAVRGLEPIDA
ncbi:MAG TPA: dipeptide epimerase [Polyangiaceae bacterium]|nr:dipeptide epimerase [Polyangiaceae bacterium]